jgi:hypothetical protein
MIGRSLGPLIGAYIADAISLQAAMWAAVIFWFLNIGLWFPIFAYIKSDLAKIHKILTERAIELKSK